MWERRAPLAPRHVAALVSNGWQVVVQPSPRRIFSDDGKLANSSFFPIHGGGLFTDKLLYFHPRRELTPLLRVSHLAQKEYVSAGAEVGEDLGRCSVLLGVKQVDPRQGQLVKGCTHLFFSHTTKGQAENMPLLDECLAERVTLVDYELIVDPGPGGKRLVAFGEYAGTVGMVDGLQLLGQRLLADGFDTPFLAVPPCVMQPGLEEALFSVARAGEKIRAGGLPPGLGPVVLAFTGGGNVATGARRVADLLPLELLEVEELPALAAEAAAAQAASSRRNVERNAESAVGKGGGDGAGKAGSAAEWQRKVFAVHLDPRHLVQRFGATEASLNQGITKNLPICPLRSLASKKWHFK